MKQKLAIIGLDCASPELVFNEFKDDLPTLSRRGKHGRWGRSKSVTPPITVPAWSCMFSGRDPGELGVYGFRNRRDFSYENLSIATADFIHAPRLWDILGKHDYRSIVIGVPQTYPPRPLNGALISGLLTPGTENRFTHPPTLKQEILARFHDYQFDVADFRSMGLEKFLKQLYSMTRNRFDVAKYLTDRYEWDSFFMVEIGLDRLQHVLWQYMDESHPLYVPNHPYSNAIRKYYQFLDQQIGELISGFSDDTRVIIVSDHGAQAMQGGFYINEWLIQNDYLTLKNPYPDSPTELIPKMIDWSRTKAWGTGGYYGRIFLNVAGRETEGIIPSDEYESVRNELKQALSRITVNKRTILENAVYKPEEIYRDVKNIAPDLMVFFDDLRWRSLGTIGNNVLTSISNDIGPDGANHAWDGIFIHSDGGNKLDGREIRGMELLDFVPSILQLLGISTENLDLSGKVMEI